MIQTFEEFTFKNPFVKKKIYTHADVDPLGEEEWDDIPNDLITRENFRKREVYVDGLEYGERRNDVYLHVKDNVNLRIGHYIISAGICHFFLYKYFDNPSHVKTDNGLIIVDNELYDRMAVELGKKFTRNKTYNEFFKRILNHPKTWKFYSSHLP
jgi:hypothetical protein